MDRHLIVINKCDGENVKAVMKEAKTRTATMLFTC